MARLPGHSPDDIRQALAGKGEHVLAVRISEGGVMTRRPQNLRKHALADACDLAVAKQVAMTITAPNGTVYRIDPAGVTVRDEDGLDAWRARKAQRGNPRPV